MNRERMEQLAEAIEAAPHHNFTLEEYREAVKTLMYNTREELPTEFNMSLVRCGSTGCIHGFVFGLFGYPGHEALGLDFVEFGDLGFPSLTHVTYNDVQPSEAAYVIRQMLQGAPARQAWADIDHQRAVSMSNS